MEHLETPTSEARIRTVPFVDLSVVTHPVREWVLADWEDIMTRGAFVNGPAVEAFEVEFAAFAGRSHCVGVASGLDALRLGLAALGVGAGDEVLVPGLTFIATLEAVAQVGATPVPVDIGDDDYGLDPMAVEAAITPNTRALVPVHLYGQMSDMTRLLEIADRRGLHVIEDAAQAHGAMRDGRHAGACGSCGAFSFYPSKNLGAMGDAGALVTDDVEIAERVRALRQHGETEKYHSRFVGYTSRLDALQAVVLSRKLPLLAEWNEQRRRAAALYAQMLEGLGDLRLPREVPGAMHVWHLYAVRTADPDALGAHLATHGIATGRHYPEPPHLSLAFESLGVEPGSCPVAETVARETLSLPLFPGITEAQIAHVTSSVQAFFDRG